MSCSYEDSTSSVRAVEDPPQNIREKRKASSSPGSEIAGTVGTPTRRPAKTRVIVSTESSEDQRIKETSGSEDEEATSEIIETGDVTSSDKDADASYLQR